MRRSDAAATLDGIMRPSWASLCLGIALAAIGMLATVGLRWPFQPSLDEVLSYDADAALRWGAVPFAAVAAAALAAILARLTRLGSTAGSFGACVASCAAGGLASCAALLPTSVETMWAGAVAAAVACALSAPFVRERGVLSLALGGALAVLPHVVAFRAANGLAISAAPLTVVAGSLSRTAAPTVGLLLGDGIDDELALAIGLRMAPPFSDRAVPLVAARADSAAGSWLRRLPVELRELTGMRCDPVAASTDSLRAAQGVEASADRGHGTEWPLRIRWERAVGSPGAECAVLTPFGSVDGSFDERGMARFDAAAQARLRRWIASMPPDGRIFVVVVPPSAADPPGWISFAP